MQPATAHLSPPVKNQRNGVQLAASQASSSTNRRINSQKSVSIYRHCGRL